MSGNEPPAGGFGAAGRVGGEIVHVPASPKRPLALGVVAVVVGVLSFLGYIEWLGYKKYELVRHGQARQDLEGLERLVVAGYEQHGALCPSAAPLPVPGHALPADVPAAELTNDPGWRCLGYVPNGTMRARIRYERIGDDQVILTSATGYERKGRAVHWVKRGYVDGEKKTVSFDETVEQPDL